MNNKPTRAFEISRDLGGLHCELHHLGISTHNSKENVVVKVCCKYFRDEVEKILRQKFGINFVNERIRLQLPAVENSITVTNSSTAES